MPPKPVLTVDENVVFTAGEARYVLVPGRDGRTFQRRAVEIGRVINGRAVVVAGLAEGDRVVRRRAFFLDADQRRVRLPGREPAPVIARLVGWSARNLRLVVLGSLLVAAAGLLARHRLSRDVIPDLSDPQVVVLVDWMGHPAARSGPRRDAGPDARAGRRSRRRVPSAGRR